MHDSWYTDDQEQMDLEDKVPAQFNLDQFNKHSLLPWKIYEKEYEIWSGMKMIERTIVTAWIHGQLKGELPIINQVYGAKDGCMKIALRKEDAEFIVEAVNSYYLIREENRKLKSALNERAT